MIAIDDMNNWIGAMEDKALTPHIDALAASGVLFDKAYCVVPACNPSRTALMSGLRPETTGQYTNAGNFREKPGGREIVTLAQYLQEHGYKTVEAGKIFHQPRGNGEEPNPMSDTASWDFQRRGHVGTPGHSLFLDANERALWLDGAGDPYISGQNSGMSYMTKFGVWGAIPQSKEECGDWQMADFCAEYLAEKHDQPFFLALGIFRPHSPQLVPQEFLDLYPLDQITLPSIPENEMEDVPGIAQTNWSSPFVQLVKEKGEWEKAVQGYLASMTFADACVGHVMHALSNSEYADNTVVLFWTDHGWQLGHKDRWEKFSLWHQGTNSPLVIRYPGMEAAGQVCSEAVSFLDLYPTLLDLLGLPRKNNLEGESLVPWLEDPGLKKETPAIVTYPRGNHSVVLGNWNYIHYEDGSEELYDHHTDPAEYHNLAGNPRYREIKDSLRQWLPVLK
jgi:arylsulfatase A-like enzyme